MRDVFWFNNPQIIFKNYNVFFPNKNFSLIKNLNAVVRLFVYYTLLCIIFTNNDLYDVIKPLLLIMFITIVIYMNSNDIELFENKKIIVTENRTSTIENPLMNLSVSDYNSNKNIIIDENVSNETINNNLTTDLPYNEDGGSSKKMFERSFYTMPVTNLNNDQTEFAKWLYDNGPTCKENTILCYDTIPDRLQMGRSSTNS
tara:strand:- start:725 stop:1327 length:603 start_codon:yes stop_codon:yes gene_type:complete